MQNYKTQINFPNYLVPRPKKTVRTQNPLDTSLALEPTFYIFSKNRKTNFRIPQDEKVFKIGRNKECDVTIDDLTISKEQIAVIKIDDFCYFMDCGIDDCVFFNGVKRRQATIASNNRLIIKAGNTWIIYIGLDASCANFEDTNTNLLKRAILEDTQGDENPEAELLIKSKFGDAVTDEAPILVGSHKACDYKIKGAGIRPFHFIIYFNPNGTFIEDLTHGKPGIKVNHLNCIGPRPIEEDITISVGFHNIFVYVYGHLQHRCEHLFHGLKEKPALVLTPLKCSDNLPIQLPKLDHQLSIGRANDCDIHLEDPSISRHHAFIQVNDKSLYLTDNHSANQSFVNLNPVEKAKVQPGDIIEFGNSCFLLHYAS